MPLSLRHPLLPCLLAGILLLPSTHSLQAGDWPWWRGPSHDGIAEAGQDPPLTFGGDENVKWAIDLPGRSHGSACVFGDQVVVAFADEEKQLQGLLAFDRTSGKSLWTTVLHENGLTQKSNKKASWASGTPACDGERFYISFVSGDGAFASAVDLDGKRLWQTRLTDYKIHQGYGASPTLFGDDLVIFAADNKLGGVIAGLQRTSGEITWEVKREKKPNYPSPVILEAAGKAQLFMTGTDKVTSLDPATGKVNWEIEGATTECVTTTITDGKRIFTSGGFPENHVSAIEADGSGKMTWKVKDRVYVPSMLLRDGHLYAVMDSGVAICWDSATGEEKWKERLGGNFSASPVWVGDRIYVPSESGECVVFTASPDGMEILAKNQVGDEVFATPSICGSEIYLRIAFYEGQERREKLICFAKP